MSLKPSEDAKTWSMLAHLSGLLIFASGFLNLVAVILIWLTKGKESKYTEKEALEALNFQISLMIYYVVAGILCIVLIGFVLLAALGLFQLIISIIAAVEANRGKGYRYPLCIRFIK